MPTPPPIIIGITADVADDKYTLGRAYAALVDRAGGLPVILPALPDRSEAYLDLCSGFILSGGDDPDTRRWGIPIHPEARPIDPDRQAFEWALLDGLGERRDRPALGICLGMQLMAVHAGGVLDQHLPDNLPSAGDHWGRKEHAITGDLGSGTVVSHHRQAITDPGTMRVVARAPDGVIEAVRDERRGFYLGVQWHPERTGDEALGANLIRALVEAAATASLSAARA